MTPLFGILLIGAGIVATKLLFYIIEYYRVYKIASAIPGPGIGFVIKYLRQGKKAFTHPVISDAIWNAMQTYKPTVKFWSGPVLMVLVTDPRDLEYFFTNKELLNKSPMYRLHEPLVGKGLITINGDTWKKHRKAITPFLHMDILREYVRDFRSKAVTLADRLETAINGKSEIVGLERHLRLTSADITCKTILATDAVTHHSDIHRFTRAVTIGAKLPLYRVMLPWFTSTTLFRMCSKYYKYHVEMTTSIDDFINRIVKQKRECKTQISQGGRRAFIDLLINSEEGGQLSDEELQQEMKTLVTAATGSTTDTLGFLFQVLALRQDIQDEVVREVTAKLDESGKEWSDDIATQFSYLDRVVKETLRLFPAIPLIARAVHKDTKMPSGVVVPRGAHLVACFLATHRDEKYFPDPLKFDPDRHLPERKSEVHPFAYVPFSAGPRNCIAQRFAMLAIKTVAATVVHRFRIYPAECAGGELAPKEISDIPFNLGITLSGRDGYKVRLVPRRNTTTFAGSPTGIRLE